MSPSDIFGNNAGNTPKSPWSRPSENSPENPTQGTTTAQAQDDEADRSYWQLKAGERLIAFLEAERHAMLSLFFQAQYPAYPNKIYALGALDERLSFVDALMQSAANLQEGGVTPENLIAETVAVKTTKTALKPYKAMIEDIKSLETVKLRCPNRHDFDHAFVLQYASILDAMEKSLHRDNAMNDDFAYVLERIHGGIEHVLEHGYFPAPSARADLSQWPLVQPLITVAQNMALLAQQAQAFAIMLEFNAASHDFGGDARTAFMIEFVTGIQLLAENICTNILVGIKEEIYLFDLTESVEGFEALYGDDALDPDTDWALDDNIMIQIKIRALTKRIIEDLMMDEEMAEEPFLLALLPSVAALMMQCVEEKYPAQDALKPAFVKDREAAANAALEVEQSHPKVDSIVPQKRSREKAKKPAPKPM